MLGRQIKKAEKYIVVSKAGKTPEAIKVIQDLVRLGPRLIAFYGKDSAELETICDLECVGDGLEPIIEITTTSHPDESFEDVTNMVELWEIQKIGETFELVEV